PHFVPEFRHLTGRHPQVAKYIRSFPQTQEFIDRIAALLVYLIPHYVREGKSYLTIGFGCTGGQHRSVMIAEEGKKLLAKPGYRDEGARSGIAAHGGDRVLKDAGRRDVAPPRLEVLLQRSKPYETPSRIPGADPARRERRSG